MIVWVVLGLFVLVACIYFVNSYQNKYQSFQGNVFNTLAVAFIVFVLGSVGYVYASSKTNVSNLEGIIQFFKLYYNWFILFIKNTGRVAGYVVKQNWTINSSFSP